jgi:hypothetical protein
VEPLQHLTLLLAHETRLEHLAKVRVFEGPFPFLLIFILGGVLSSG